METAEELETKAEQLEQEAILLEEAGKPVAATAKLQQAKRLGDRALLLRQQAGRQLQCACDVWTTGSCPLTKRCAHCYPTHQRVRLHTKHRAYVLHVLGSCLQPTYN